jgi:hypothetical protein
MLSSNKQPEFVNPENLELARARVEKARADRMKCMETIYERVHSLTNDMNEALETENETETEM